MIQDKVIDKIKKLLERTEENGCTPGEVAAASAQVAMLLAKHNLSMSDINSEDMELVKEEFVKDTKSASAYQSEIASALQEHFGVKVFVRTKLNGFKGTYRVLAVYGEKIKVQAFTTTFEFIYRSYQKFWTAYHKTLEIPTKEKSLMRLSYLRGFIDGVTNEIIKEENANALVVSKSQAVLDFEQSLGGAVHFSAQSKYNSAARGKGYSDGAFAQNNRNHAIH